MESVDAVPSKLTDHFNGKSDMNENDTDIELPQTEPNIQVEVSSEKDIVHVERSLPVESIPLPPDNLPCPAPPPCLNVNAAPEDHKTVDNFEEAFHPQQNADVIAYEDAFIPESSEAVDNFNEATVPEPSMSVDNFEGASVPETVVAANCFKSAGSSQSNINADNYVDPVSLEPAQADGDGFVEASVPETVSNESEFEEASIPQDSGHDGSLGESSEKNEPSLVSDSAGSSVPIEILEKTNEEQIAELVNDFHEAIYEDNANVCKEEVVINSQDSLVDECDESSPSDSIDITSIKNDNIVEEVVIKESGEIEDDDGGGTEEDEEEDVENNRDLDCTNPILVTRAASETDRNFQSAILEDWDPEGGTTLVVNGLVDQRGNEKANVDVVNSTPLPNTNDSSNANKTAEPSSEETNDDSQSNKSHTSAIRHTRLELSSYRMSRQEAVKEIINAEPKPLNSILSGKNLFLSIELAKRSRAEAAKKAKTLEDSQREELLEILESDQVGDWREAIPSVNHQKVIDDIGIELEVRSETVPPAPAPAPPSATSTKREPRRRRMMDTEAERLLALQQLETQFAVRKRKRRVAEAPQSVAAADLERALSATPVLTGRRKRRPCYLPEKKEEVDPEVLPPNPNAVVKTYSSKRKSLDVNSEVQTGLETITAVNKHLSLSHDEEKVDGVKKPKEQKVIKRLKKRSSDPQKKRNYELQQLLGDEGAVRMIYDAAHKESSPDGSPRRPHVTTKKDLLQKTKYVQNAVMRLSGASEKSLRGKRLPVTPSAEGAPLPEPLFPPATPGSIPARSRKKPRPAEASRILYRHSSSESFDDSESFQRSSTDLAGPDQSPERSPMSLSNVLSPVRKSTRPRKLSSRFSVWVAESLSMKKSKKSEDDRLSSEFQVLKLEPTVPKTNESAANEAPKTSTTLVKSTRKSEDPAATGKTGRSKAQPASTTKEPSVRSVRSRSDAETDRSAGDVSFAVPDKLEDKGEVEVTQRNSIVTIQLSSIKASIKNGLTPEVLLDLKRGLDDAAQNTTCKVVVISGTGNVFCQGVDLALLVPGYDVAELVDAIRGLVMTLLDFEKPIIAAVQGAAVGLGVGILPLCDIVVASDRATFYTPYTRLGQGPEGATSVTFPKIGTALVCELMYKCSKITAADGLRLGLVSQILPSKAFASDLNALCDCICEQSNQALKTLKHLLTENGREAILKGLDRECESLHNSWTSADTLAAISDFLPICGLIPNS